MCKILHALKCKYIIASYYGKKGCDSQKILPVSGKQTVSKFGFGFVDQNFGMPQISKRLKFGKYLRFCTEVPSAHAQSCRSHVQRCSFPAI